MINWQDGAISYIETGWVKPHSDGPTAIAQVYGDKTFVQTFPSYISRNHEKIDPGFTHPRAENSPQSLYDAQMAYFIQCIRNQHTPSPGPLKGWINMKIINAAYESARRGKVVKVE
jgi:predicted dehydrogenase